LSRHELFDYSPAMQRRFVAFLRARYGSEEALCRAWSREGLRFDDPLVPEDRLFGGLDSVRNSAYWQAALETNGSGNVPAELVMAEWQGGLAHCGVPYRIYLFEDLELDNFPGHRLFYSAWSRCTRSGAARRSSDSPRPHGSPTSRREHG
jgi:hypothetical protein